MAMKFEMEELIPIVSMLAEKYTSKESSSVTYETAEKLMEAVIYCIDEYDNENKFINENDFENTKHHMKRNGHLCKTENAEYRNTEAGNTKEGNTEERDTEAGATKEGNGYIIVSEDISAKKAYELGLEVVRKKVSYTLKSYNEMMRDFCDYSNCCLRDTIVKGFPEFFKWYDYKFAPQNTILTLDYPILVDLTMYSGIDRIQKYLRCIEVEQSILSMFPKEIVIEILDQYDSDYKNMIDNLCEIVLHNVCEHLLMNERELTKKLDEDMRKSLHYEMKKMGRDKVEDLLINKVDKLLRSHFDNGRCKKKYNGINDQIENEINDFYLGSGIRDYMKLAIQNIVVRMTV